MRTSWAALAIEKSRSTLRAQGQVCELQAEVVRTKARLDTAERIGDTQRQLLDLVLAGCDLETFVRLAGTALDSALVVVDPGGQQLALTQGAAALDDGQLLAALLDAAPDSDPVPLPGQAWACSAISEGAQLGTVLMCPRSPASEEQLQLLRVVAQSTAIFLLAQRGEAQMEGQLREAQMEGQLREALLDDLLSVPQPNSRKLVERALSLAIDLAEPTIVVVAKTEGARALAWASSYAYRLGGLKTGIDGQIVLLLPQTDAGAAARTVAKELGPLLGHVVTVGAAGPAASPEAILDVYREAVRCLDALTLLGATGSASSAQELGFLGLLLADHRDIDGFLAKTLGPLLDYDRQRQTSLIPTLEAYFESSGSPTNAATLLFVHPNTVARRLNRIGELLGPEWQSPDWAVELQIALRLLRTRRTLREQDVTTGGLSPLRASR
jgi:sugar diacid utilization regulator